MSYVFKTKLLPATTHKGTRIKVQYGHNTMIIPWDYRLNADENHMFAIRKFAHKLFGHADSKFLSAWDNNSLIAILNHGIIANAMNIAE